MPAQSREKRLERLLSEALHLLDRWEDIALATGQEPEGYGQSRAALQAEYDTLK
mgnify:CR=1 FL=1